MTVTNANARTAATARRARAWPFPSNGVIYVSTASSGLPRDLHAVHRQHRYTSDTNCGNVYVSGNYSQLADDRQRQRHHHQRQHLPPRDRRRRSAPRRPATSCSGSSPTTSCASTTRSPDRTRHDHAAAAADSATNGTGSLTNPTIYAAILAVNHSFIVDNYDCGSRARARSPSTARSRSSSAAPSAPAAAAPSTGYAKNYIYDDRLATIEPPYFLNPVDAPGTSQRETECDAASTC